MEDDTPKKGSSVSCDSHLEDMAGSVPDGANWFCLPVASVDHALSASAAAFDPRRLTLARHRSGWTKRHLSEIIGVSAAAITQWELGQARPSASSVGLLAVHLGVPATYFATGRPLIAIDTAEAHFRSLRSTRLAERQQALATMAHFGELIAVLSRVVRLPQIDVPDAGWRVGQISDTPAAPQSLDLASKEPAKESEGHASPRSAEDADHGIPESAAQQVRKAWNLRRGPLPHLLRQIEMHGIPVAVARFGSSERIDAFSSWPVSLGRPVICLSSERGNVLRRRFTAAHELGHLVLHSRPVPGSIKHEREANRFAAEFLMPREDIEPLLPRRLDLAHLIELQQQWGVSVQALLRRCVDLGILTENIYKRGMATISQLGWRRQEPTLEYKGEWPAMLAEALDLIKERGISEPILARGLCLPSGEIRELLGFVDEERPVLRLVVSDSTSVVSNELLDFDDHLIIARTRNFPVRSHNSHEERSRVFMVCP
jgi:Zn-dependent peptidase ImmA (M78 family)/transcriptional regulator with XRE-family HTH domain